MLVSKLWGKAVCASPRRRLPKVSATVAVYYEDSAIAGLARSQPLKALLPFNERSRLAPSDLCIRTQRSVAENNVTFKGGSPFGVDHA